MKLAYLYTTSELTPWKENVNPETLAFLVSQTPVEIYTEIVHFEGFNGDMIDKLSGFDLVFNLCYGYQDAGQVEVAGWLQHYGIKHTASSFDALTMAQDKSLLPDICAKLDLATPEVWYGTEVLNNETLYISKPRKGSCHRDIHINKGSWMKTNIHPDVDDLIIQPYIPGREFSVAVIPVSGGKYYHALPPVEIVPEDKDRIYIAGQSFGTTFRDFAPSVPENIVDELMEASEKLHKLIGLKGMSRTDFRVSHDGTVYVLDVNAMPNMDPVRSLMPNICQFHGVSITDLITRVIANNDINLGKSKKKSKDNIEVLYS